MPSGVDRGAVAVSVLEAPRTDVELLTNRTSGRPRERSQPVSHTAAMPRADGTATAVDRPGVPAVSSIGKAAAQSLRARTIDAVHPHGLARGSGTLSTTANVVYRATVSVVALGLVVAVLATVLGIARVIGAGIIVVAVQLPGARTCTSRADVARGAFVPVIAVCVVVGVDAA